ncbi:hypothetical protein [Rhodoflexus caldus]|uniref:hypothetical protein n=1 Tax=Rhodoflexus caldus TaxID=2891236 RepID=UPI002029D52D|nr:hypothetical protein [Rhodoflexus caldus]
MQTDYSQILQVSKDRLSLPELDALIAELISIRKQKMPHFLSQKETELLQKINADLPVDIKSRYALLNAKRAEESVSEAEYQGLMELTNFI